jgi:hypothetical protein
MSPVDPSAGPTLVADRGTSTTPSVTSAGSQESFSTLEMASRGGSVTFSNLTGTSTTALNVGDTWQLAIQNGPPNSPVNQLLSDTYPPQFKQVGTTDANGNFTLTGTVTQAQAGSVAYQPFYLQFANTTPGYQDPTAPAGYRNVLVGLVDYSVQTPAPATSAASSPDPSPAAGSGGSTAAPVASLGSQEDFSTYEMKSLGGSVIFSNLTGNSTTALNEGDAWQLAIEKGPPNSPVNLLLNGNVYPLDFATVGSTDASGDFTLTGTVTKAQAGSDVYQPFYLQFPNTYPGYQDPTAPAGYRNVLVGLVNYSVGPQQQT